MTIKKITITFSRETRCRKSIVEILIASIERIFKAFIHLCEVVLMSNLRLGDKAAAFRLLIVVFALIFQSALFILAWIFIQK